MRAPILTFLTLTTLVAAPALAQTTRPADRTPSQRPTPGGAVVDLRPRFTVGQDVKLSMEVSTKTTTTGPAATDDPDHSKNGETAVGMTLSLKCTDVDPETGYTLQLKVEALRVNGDVQGERVNWDSTKQGKDEALDAALGSIVGTTIPVTMDKNGNISDFGAGIAGALGGKGDSFFKGMFGPLSTRTSNTGEARVGDKWSNDETMQAGLGMVKIRTDNTLKSASSGMAVISTKGTFSLDPTSTSQGVRLKDGKLDGETKWNTADHMIESMNMKQKVVSEKRDTTTGQVSTSTQTSDIRVHRVRTGR